MKTAIDYFMQSLGINENSKFEITDADGSPKVINVSEVYEQAKAMEKQQIIYAHESGVGCNDYGYGIEYYNETYKSE